MDSFCYMVQSLLIMDQASMHITEDIIKEIEKNDTEIIFVQRYDQNITTFGCHYKQAF